ncbi:MAG: hypothetical protein ACLFPI_11635 [Desulfobacterales bacterium]
MIFAGSGKRPWIVVGSGKTETHSLVFWMLVNPWAGFSAAAFGPGICTARYAASGELAHYRVLKQAPAARLRSPAAACRPSCNASSKPAHGLAAWYRPASLKFTETTLVKEVVFKPMGLEQFGKEF